MNEVLFCNIFFVITRCILPLEQPGSELPESLIISRGRKISTATLSYECIYYYQYQGVQK